MALDPEARRILDLARAARTPSEDDRARLQRRLTTAIGVSIASGASIAAAEAGKSIGVGKATGSLVALKFWVGGGALVAVAAVSYLSLGPATRTPRATGPATALAARAVSAPSTSVTEPPVMATQAGEQAPAENARAPERAARHPERHQKPAALAPLASELELLHRAQAAWRSGDGKLALALLDQHAASYPRSSLSLERDGLRVLTLCELGRHEEASRSAHSFLVRAPRSPMRPSIEQSCALK
jgi:RNA polymerase sigma-70 factor (ECF subfamily)